MLSLTKTPDSTASYLLKIFAVGAGGFVGTLARYLLTHLGGSHWTTFAVNLLGTFTLGIVVAYIRDRGHQRPRRYFYLQLFLSTGLLGGFTTYSAFALDTVQLVTSGAILEALLYSVLSLGLAICGLLLGLATGKHLAQ